MAKKSLLGLVHEAHKNSVSIERHRISREDADRVRAAEKRSHNEAVKLLLEIVFRKT